MATTSSAPDRRWVDGRIVRGGTDAPGDSGSRALAEDRACYTTALVRAGRPVWAKRHAARLRRDAAAREIGDIGEDGCLSALAELSHACFEGRDGIVRALAIRRPEGPQLLAEPRELGSDRSRWRCRLAAFPHRTEGRWTGAKGSNHPLYERARREMQAAALDEMLLTDREGFLVEGCISNLFVVDADGALVAPNLSRGAVAGLAQQLVHERVDEVVVRDLPTALLGEAREIIAVNAVRQARPIVEVDGEPVGDGEPGSWFERIRQILADEP